MIYIAIKINNNQLKSMTINKIILVFKNLFIKLNASNRNQY